MGLWVYVSMCLWVYVSVGLWVCGSMGLWVCVSCVSARCTEWNRSSGWRCWPSSLFKVSAMSGVSAMPTGRGSGNRVSGWEGTGDRGICVWFQCYLTGLPWWPGDMREPGDSQSQRRLKSHLLSSHVDLELAAVAPKCDSVKCVNNNYHTIKFSVEAGWKVLSINSTKSFFSQQ